jgi:hypothetical protein
MILIGEGNFLQKSKPRSLFVSGKEVQLLKFRVRSLSVFFAVIIVFIILLVGNHSVRGDQRAYDDEEAARRLGEQLYRLDQAERDAARRRYYEKDSSISPGEAGAFVGSAIIILMVIGAVAIVKKKRKQQLTSQFTEVEDTENQDTLFTERLEKATLLGFNISKKTKECPACAETIKLKANICRYCRKQFSEDEVQEAIRAKVDIFLADHVST